MTRKYLAKALRSALVILATVLAPGVGKALNYEVTSVKLLADGKWQSAKKTAPGKFLFEFAPSWPQPMTVYVTWDVPPSSTNPNYVGGPKPCRNMSTDLPYVAISRNGQTMPGHPKANSKDSFSYAFTNVTRFPPSDVKALCIKFDQGVQHTLAGYATISFRPQDPLHDFNPGIAKPVLPSLASIDEFLKPIEGETLPHGQPVAVQVKGKFVSPYSRPKKLQVELERAINVQTGVVGEIALPGNQPYITWKPVTKLWVDVNWSPTGAYNYRGSLQMPSNLFSEGGLYHVHVVGAPAQWRTFKVKLPMMFRKVP